MLALFRRKNPYEQKAAVVYAALLERARMPVFYRSFGVPDTQEARYDLLLVHAFIVVNRMAENKDFTQALFDAVFADMDQTLREIGIGDTGVPKRMRRLMKAFNGRMHAYTEALGDEAALKETLARNLYAGVANPQAEHLERMKNYVQRSLDLIQQQPETDIMEGRPAFAAAEAYDT